MKVEKIIFRFDLICAMCINIIIEKHFMKETQNRTFNCVKLKNISTSTGSVQLMYISTSTVKKYQIIYICYSIVTQGNIYIRNLWAPPTNVFGLVDILDKSIRPIEIGETTSLIWPSLDCFDCLQTPPVCRTILGCRLSTVI